MKKYIVSILVLFVCATSISQNKKDVLLTVNGKPVYSSEFIRVYSKNLDLVKEESQKSVDGYLDLFIDYNLKVAEAHAEKLDENKAYIDEFNKYRDQLSRNYIYEEEVTNELAHEAYDRGLEEINADHILILADYEDSPQDTLKAYNKAKMVLDKARAGEDFETLVKTYSEEPNANKSAGKLGYFTVFNMVYPFENMAYNTKPGKISNIVRTRFGYHIIKVNDRRIRAEKISVSHIMIADNGEERTFDPKERINEISALLKQGETFESLAKQYSDDKNSAKQGGKLSSFRRGDLRAPEFEDAAYNLQKSGDVSDPVKTQFGWHIIRLEEKFPITTFEDEKEQLLSKLKGGLRSKMVTSALNDKIKELFDYKVVTGYKKYFNDELKTDYFGKDWKFADVDASKNKVIFKLDKKEFTYNDFGAFLTKGQRRIGGFKQKDNMLASFYDEFETFELLKYYKENLEEENEEYGAILNEYRNGLLIFDVMNENIWTKAKNDSVGLKKFYETIKNNYQWGERVEGVIYSATSNEAAKQVESLLKEAKTADEIKAAMNTDDTVNVIVSDGKFELGKRELPESFNAIKGVSPIYSKDNRFVIVNVREVMPSEVKELDAVKGKVMSEYQTYLEKTWIEGLRSKYDVEINKKALKKVKKELNS
ncbi:peptidylprolyl isomerase [Ulvibacter antarcticus]|uniref:Peptidyl-prolyl cis-trans isomerase SurA n=1 Tax=Ulvibacter antarcticus TaxID=442714 RepID=A0A3L9YFZ4_9FLAO|nr:peptidylprolyl isomerase [Ulvibacter antarcticus]RMA58049.1 peptidyl-prolyl cis-trans isomerase SurA [Ulvibacter antarcticus]